MMRGVHRSWQPQRRNQTISPQNGCSTPQENQEIIVKKPDTKQLLAGSRTVGLLWGLVLPLIVVILREIVLRLFLPLLVVILWPVGVLLISNLRLFLPLRLRLWLLVFRFSFRFLGLLRDRNK